MVLVQTVTSALTGPPQVAIPTHGAVSKAGRTPGRGNIHPSSRCEIIAAVRSGNLDRDVASVKFSFDRKLDVDLVVDQVLLDGFRAF